MTTSPRPDSQHDTTRTTSRTSAVQQVKASAEALLAEGKSEEAWDFFLQALEAVLAKNRELELLVAKLRRERLGSTSEKIDPGQLALLFETMMEQAPGPEPIDAEAEAREDAALTAEIESAEGGAGRAARARKKGPGWTTRAVERRVHHERVPAEERAIALRARCHGPGILVGRSLSRATASPDATAGRVS